MAHCCHAATRMFSRLDCRFSFPFAQAATCAIFASLRRHAAPCLMPYIRAAHTPLPMPRRYMLATPCAAMPLYYAATCHVDIHTEFSAAASYATRFVIDRCALLDTPAYRYDAMPNIYDMRRAHLLCAMMPLLIRAMALTHDYWRCLRRLIFTLAP